MNEGDIYHWSYKNPDGFSYWAKSRIAIVRNNRLRDTYWMYNLEAGSSSSDGASWDFSEVASCLDLEFVANISDLQKQAYDNSDYFDNADVVNLNHANAPKGNLYLRKNARRSQTKMLEVARYKRERCISDILHASETVRRLDSAIRMIESDEPLDAIHL